MKLVQEYLYFLNEDLPLSKYNKFKETFVGKNLHGGFTSSLWFGLVVTPAVIASWKAANFAFSKSVRKCGGVLASRTPGFKVCVSKEKIKALNLKMSIAKKMISQCSKGKNPDLCKQKFELEIEKCRNRIQIEKNKIKQNLGEQTIPSIVQGAGKIAAGAGGMGIMIGASMVADKVMNLTLRTAQALYSSAARKCGVYKESGPERNMCISKVKLAALEKQLVTYNKWLATCSKSKNPQQCKEKVKEKIIKISKSVEIEKSNLIAYQHEIETKKREEELKNSMNQKK